MATVKVLITCELDNVDYESAIALIESNPFTHYVNGEDIIYDYQVIE
jgi:hypothetical protein